MPSPQRFTFSVALIHLNAPKLNKFLFRILFYKRNRGRRHFVLLSSVFKSIFLLIFPKFCADLKKYCFESNSFVPFLRIILFLILIYTFCPNFNTNAVSTAVKFLYRIQKFRSFFMSVLFQISIQICQFIESCSEFKSYVHFIGELCSIFQHKRVNSLAIFWVPGISLVELSELAECR